jgi:NAD(P)-dependent dehydrogenase (short-subunit alcohol dehydrogenase family)
MGVDIAKAALARGHAVVATGRNTELVRQALGIHDDLLIVKLDVTDPDDARAALRAAVDRFGRIDVLINNAGIIRWAGFPDADASNLASHFAVHVGGSFNTTRAAWPHMVEQRYGRIVMTTSAGLFGLPQNLSYATAKGAAIGLTRSLNTAAAAHGIKVNLIAPAAVTRMAGGATTTQMAPDLVAPMVAFLAHEDCPVSGEIYAAGAGRFARIFIASTPGYVHTGSEPTVQDVADNWATINDETGYLYRPISLTGPRHSCPPCARQSSGTARRGPASARGAAHTELQR